MSKDEVRLLLLLLGWETSMFFSREIFKKGEHTIMFRIDGSVEIISQFDGVSIENFDTKDELYEYIKDLP